MRSATEKRRGLRAQIDGGEMVVAVGSADALQAQMVERAGLGAIHGSGSVAHISAGYPDENLLTLTEMTMRMAMLADAVDIPVIADGESGFGNTLNVTRMIREYERVGVAALHLEDSLLPKRAHSHGAADDFVSKQEFVDKIRAAVDARTDEGLIIIARSEFKGDYQEVLDRLAACLEAGADMAWLSVRDADGIRATKRTLQKPLIGVLPAPMSAQEYHEHGASAALIPGALQVVSIHAQQQLLQTLANGGSVNDHYATQPGVDEMSRFYFSKMH